MNYTWVDKYALIGYQLLMVYWVVLVYVTTPWKCNFCHISASITCIYMTVLTAIPIMQMGNECSSPSLVVKASCKGEWGPTSWFHHFAFSLYVPMQNQLSIVRTHHPLCNFSFTSFPLQVIVYEKPFFEGRHVEIESEIFMLDEKESEDKTRLPLTSVGSMKVLGGV